MKYSVQVETRKTIAVKVEAESAEEALILAQTGKGEPIDEAQSETRASAQPFRSWPETEISGADEGTE